MVSLITYSEKINTINWLKTDIPWFISGRLICGASVNTCAHLVVHTKMEESNKSLMNDVFRFVKILYKNMDKVEILQWRPQDICPSQTIGNDKFRHLDINACHYHVMPWFPSRKVMWNMLGGETARTHCEKVDVQK